MRLRIRYWLPAILWMAVIFVFSTDLFSASNTDSWLRRLLATYLPSLSDVAIEVIHHIVRKMAHISAYAVLSVAYYLGLRQAFRLRGVWSPKTAGVAIVLAVLYASTDEWHQSFSNHRTASILDVGYDAVGAIVAQGLLFFRATTVARSLGRLTLW